MAQITVNEGALIEALFPSVKASDWKRLDERQKGVIEERVRHAMQCFLAALHAAEPQQEAANG